MYINIRKRSYFLDMINDDNYAMFCLDVLSTYNYTMNELMVLKNYILYAKSSIDSCIKKKKFFSIFKNPKLNDKINKKLNDNIKMLDNCNSKLEKFESELAYIIIKNIFKDEHLKKLGLTNTYIKDLLDRYNLILKNSFDKYYYDEKTDNLYKRSDKGEWFFLEEKPIEVIEYLATYDKKNSNIVLQKERK